MKLFRRPMSKEVASRLEFLQRSQFWGADQIREYQWEKLSSLLQHAATNIPYYRRLFERHGLRWDDIKSFDHLARIPVLTKKDIQEFLDDLVPAGTDSSRLATNSTGGSTGMPLNFYQDKNYSLWADAARLRAWRCVAGATVSDVEAVLWGAIRDIGKGIDVRTMAYHVLREGNLPLNTFDLDSGMIKKYLLYYNVVKPRTVRGYATSLYHVARYVDDNGIKIHKPKAVVSSTEVLRPRMRETIERVFGCRVYDSYGCREISQIATECEAHHGLHIVFENQYVELEGQDIIVTNLNNYLMPFIRYRVGDLASSVDYSPCPCGRFSPRIVTLVGRDNDNIELPNGKVINGEFFEFLFFGVPSVIQYQVIYSRSLQHLLIKLHLKELSRDVGSEIKRTMAEKFGFTNIAIEMTDSFDKTPTGKLRFVQSVQ